MSQFKKHNAAILSLCVHVLWKQISLQYLNNVPPFPHNMYSFGEFQGFFHHYEPSCQISTNIVIYVPPINWDSKMRLNLIWIWKMS